MTVITNPDPTIFKVGNDFDGDVRDFFLNTLGIDLTGKSLSIGEDVIGRIKFIDVDPTVVISGPQITQVQDEFFKMSIDSIINALTPANATIFLTDQGSSSPLVISIGAQSTLTDIFLVGGWNISPDAKDITLTNPDNGEWQFTGVKSKILTITYNMSLGTANQSDHVYSSLMRTPDGGAIAEIIPSRMYIETINGTDGEPISNSITIKVNPLDKIRLNVANDDGITNLVSSIVAVSIK